MGDPVTEFHNQNIVNHQAQHQLNSALATTVLQTNASDYSCIECFPPNRISPRLDFGIFWTWYSTSYYTESYTRITQTNHN